MTDDAPETIEQPTSVPVSLLVGAHLVGVMLASHFIRQEHETTRWLIAGLIDAQVNMAALWVGLGRSPLVYRWGAMTSVIAAWTYVDYMPEHDNMRQFAYLLKHAGIATLWVQAARLFGVRLLQRHSLDSETASQDTTTVDHTTRVHWDLAQLFAVTTSVACLAAGQSLQPVPVTLSTIRSDFLFNPGPVAVIGPASAWAVLSQGRWAWRVCLIIGCAWLVAIGQLVVLNLSVFDWQDVLSLGWSMYGHWGLRYATDTVIVCLSLFTFRRLGYRLAGYGP